MARIGADPSYHKTKSVETVSGRFFGGGGGAVGAIGDGKGFSVTYVSTGRYRITLDTNYPHILGGGPSLMSGSNTYQITIKAYVVNAGAGTTCSVDFLVTSAGTPTDLATNEEIWFAIDFARTQRP